MTVQSNLDSVHSWSYGRLIQPRGHLIASRWVAKDFAPLWLSAVANLGVNPHFASGICWLSVQPSSFVSM